MNARLTLVTTAAAVLAAVSFVVAQVPTPVPAVTPVVAAVSLPAPMPEVATLAAATPVVVSSRVVAVASVIPVAEPDMSQVATTQSTPKVVKPTVAPSAKKVRMGEEGLDPQAPPPPPAPPTPPPPPEPPKVQQAKVAAAPRPYQKQPVNLRLEFTITDQIGTATPVEKTVTMNVADGESGRIRTNAYVYRKNGVGNTERVGVPLSIDALPELAGTKIRLRASLEYQLFDDGPSADAPGGTTSISQSVTSILNDGVSAILSQSADPLTDRKVTLEVKATIVR